MDCKQAREVIKNNYPPENYTVLRETLDWLLEQAEKAEKLQQIREIVANAHQATRERKDMEIEQLKKDAKSDKECIAKMAKRIKAFEEKYLYL